MRSETLSCISKQSVMSNVICSCLLGDNARVRLRLSQLLHSEVEALYGDAPEEIYPDICEVELQGCRREFFSNNTGSAFSVGQQVIVESDGGYDFGVVYSTGQIARKKLRLKGLDKSGQEFSVVVRSADESDSQAILDLKTRQAEIRDICVNKIKKHELDLKLVDVELRMDQQKLSVYYTSSHRVDFRTLVRDLAGEFKARIQMVQITTREEARRANDFGPCGCLLCCSSWLQKIHANPFAEKSQYSEASGNESHAFNITGLCNRPKCCLGYSKHEKGCQHHSSSQSQLPSVGSRVATPEGAAVVESIDAQKKLVWLHYEKSDQKRKYPIEKFNALFIKKQG
ncbi:PSP1 C-terminal conserved region [Chlorobium ferrooxidans DSM 13031]|uniref:PSP1 C-terminal conserved region n=2 Tax=Chlorobium TaxID=1091 RepID=Q0YQ94_9CHLB|nr:PSP1 C-terminal conserved region [Chlorobium ferrooxidans DSM 13031]